MKKSIDDRLLDQQLMHVAKAIWASCFEQQKKIIKYRGGNLAVLCTRRAAKTTAIAARFLIRALTQRGYKGLFLALTNENVQQGFYENCIQMLLSNAGFNINTMPASLPWTLPNGSKIYGKGLDTMEKQQTKVRGGWYHDIVLDEVGFWTQDVEKIIKSVCTPALTDKDGDLIMISSPGEILNTFWHKVSDVDHPEHAKYKGWDIMKWHWRSNPYQIKNQEAKLAKELKLDPNFYSTDEYKREWEGQWVVYTSERCFQATRELNFSSDLHSIDPDDPLSYLPGEINNYIFGVGVDLGSTDDTAIVFGAWQKRTDNPILYIFDTWNEPGHDVIDVGNLLQKYCSLYKPTVRIIDGAAKQSVDTLNKKFSLNFEPAQKLGKAEHIKLMNADIKRGNIVVLKHAEPLFNEWENLVWNRKLLESKRKWEWIGGVPDHLSDAALYLYWKARFFWHSTPQPDPIKGQSYIDQMYDKYQNERDEKYLSGKDFFRGNPSDIGFFER